LWWPGERLCQHDVRAERLLNLKVWEGRPPYLPDGTVAGGRVPDETDGHHRQNAWLTQSNRVIRQNDHKKAFFNKRLICRHMKRLILFILFKLGVRLILWGLT
jgi:hypothetical protein